MKEHKYRGYLIKVEAMQTWSAEYWEGRAYIQCTEGGIVQSVSRYGPFNTLRTKEEAERDMLEDAQKWIDERIAAGK